MCVVEGSEPGVTIEWQPPTPCSTNDAHEVARSLLHREVLYCKSGTTPPGPAMASYTSTAEPRERADVLKHTKAHLL